MVKGNKNMRQMARCFLVLNLVSSVVLAQQTKTNVDWQRLLWLVGDWTASGTGGPGQGSGGFSFHQDLQGHVLVRKNFAEYPPSAEKPAYRHDDLMIIYPDGKSFRAEYFDNEGHVIRYAIDVSTDGNSVTFISDDSTSGPRFRLTYCKKAENTLAGTFEIAPPGKPNAFSKYLEWTSQKQIGK